MRNMSFAFTTEQIRNQTKTVTRRLGWKFLREYDLVQPIIKGMGLKKGEKVKKIGPPIRIVTVRRERLWQIALYEHDISCEGFHNMMQAEFVEMFCRHNRCEKDDIITRIEFEYTDGPGGAG